MKHSATITISVDGKGIVFLVNIINRIIWIKIFKKRSNEFNWDKPTD